MGHTNSTANLALPQFIGTDKPTWLGDVNGAFGAIDSKVGTIDADISAVDAKADNAVSDAAAAITTATNANNTAGTASTTATNALNIANNALTVANNADGHTNQLELKVGLLADLTTVDKDSIVDAINEVNAKTITVSVSAEDVAYNNTVSGLTATDVQAAIDELASGGSGARVLRATSTSLTTGAAAGDLKAAYDALTDEQKLNAYIETSGIILKSQGNLVKGGFSGIYARSTDAVEYVVNITDNKVFSIIFASGTTTFTDESATTVPAGIYKLYA